MAERVRKPRGIMAEPALTYGFAEEDCNGDAIPTIAEAARQIAAQETVAGRTDPAPASIGSTRSTTGCTPSFT